MEYKNIALFTDLDGTLLNSQREVSAENLRAIGHFVAEGGTFGISTGRAPANALQVLPELPINTWSVVLNGAESYHFTKKAAANLKTLPKEQTAPLIRWVLGRFPEINVEICSENQLMLLSDPRFDDNDFVSTHQPMSRLTLEEAMEYCWLKVLFCGQRSVLEQLRGYAEQTGVTHAADFVYTTETYLELLPQNVSKGSCLRAMRQQEDLRSKTFIAIGDYSNDIELLQEADIGVAVGNALDEVKAAADYIVCANDEHAIAYLIETLIPNL